MIHDGILKRSLESIFLTQFFIKDVAMSSNENSKQCAGNEHALTKPDFESKRQSFPKLDELKTANVAIRYDYVEKLSNIREYRYSCAKITFFQRVILVKSKLDGLWLNLNCFESFIFPLKQSIL